MHTINSLKQLACVLLAVLSGSALAQPIEFDGRFEETDQQLDSNEYVDEYELELRQGQLVELRMASEDVDAYLVLVLPDGEQIENDDAGVESFDAALVFIAPQTGTYTVMATTAGAEEIGQYQITGQRRALQPLDKQKGDLAPGDQVSWKGGEYCDLIEVKLAANEARAIELSSDAFDTYLVAHGPGGQILFNDDSASLDGSLLVLEAGAEGATFNLVVTSFGAGEVGPYRLTTWAVTDPDQ